MHRMSVCELPFPVLQRHTTAVITVSEEEIVSAMRLVSAYLYWDAHFQEEHFPLF